MGKGRTVIHVNPHLEHQVRIGDALKAGFKVHGLESTVSHNPNEQADTHVVLGPWFALNQWRNANTLYIDRAYWGDPKCISVHWLQYGEKVFTQNVRYRKHPDTKPYKSGHRKIYLADYGDKSITGFDCVRYHPAQVKQSRSLDADLKKHDIAVGRRTTALVDAAIAGLMVQTSDLHSPVYQINNKVSYVLRDQWLVNLAWHNWSLTEIANGDMWHALGSNGNGN